MKLIATAESQYFPNCGFISTMKGHSTSPPAFPIHQIDDTSIKAPPVLPELGYLHSDQQPRSAIPPPPGWPRSSALYQLLNATCAVTTHCAGTVPLTGKQEETVLHRLLLHKTLLISSCLGLAGTSALFCSIAGSSSFPVLFRVSFWLQLHAEDSASPATMLSAPRQSPSCREANALCHCLFFMPPWLDRGKAYQEHLAAAYVVLFPACLALYLRDKPFWR